MLNSNRIKRLFSRVQPIKLAAGGPSPANRHPTICMTTKKQAPAKPVERLFPFVIRSRALLVGRDALLRSKSKLHFILITLDVSEKSRARCWGFRLLPGRTALHVRGPGPLVRPQRNESDRLQEIGPGPIHLRRAEGASAEQTGETGGRETGGGGG